MSDKGRTEEKPYGSTMAARRYTTIIFIGIVLLSFIGWLCYKT